jgi:PAS domain S-box-containing protein
VDRLVGDAVGDATLAEPEERLRAALDAWRFQATVLESIAESTIDGILVASADGDVIFWNQRYLDLWRIPNDAVETRRHEVVTEHRATQVEDPDGFRAEIERLNSSDEVLRVETVLADGRVFDRYSTPLVGSDGTRYGRVWYARDITEQKRAEQALFETGERFASLARTLQQSLLPPHLPDMPGVAIAARYHPAGEGLDVGGDFYDVFRTTRSTWGVVMGDVCGKGAAAATVTALARYTVRAAAMQTQVPSKVLTTLNTALLRNDSHEDGDAGEERFATVAYATLRRAKDRVTVSVCCGGHPPPLLLRPDGHVEPVCGPGLVLGLFRAADLADRETELEPGDLLVLYTDGVTEARKGDELFGEERLRELLSSMAGLDAGDVAERLENAVLDFQGGTARDDTALLVLQVTRRRRRARVPADAPTRRRTDEIPTVPPSSA